MQFANNKFIATLVISNIIAFSVIFILIWILWKNDDTTNNQSLTTSNTSSQENNQLSTQPASNQKRAVTIADEIVQEVRLANLTPDETANLDSSDTGKLSDKEYIGAYKQTEKEKAAVQSYSEKEITTIKASNKTSGIKISTNEKAINNLNVVDVSQHKKNIEENKTLAQRVSSLVSANANNDISNPPKNPGWQDYLKKLNIEGAERKNEMRTIKVKRGETLWKISIRAYGTGFKYKEIFKANPHLTSPHSITAGEILRVPL